MEPIRGSERGEGGAITSIEAFVLGVMAAILVAIAIPSYVGMRNRSSDSAARAQLRQASEAAEAYRGAHGSYARMSTAALTRFDTDLRPSSYRLHFVRTDRYCIESAVRGRTWHLGAPAQAVGRGNCP